MCSSRGTLLDNEHFLWQNFLKEKRELLGVKMIWKELKLREKSKMEIYLYVNVHGMLLGDIFLSEYLVWNGGQTGQVSWTLLLRMLQGLLTWPDLTLQEEKSPASYYKDAHYIS